MSEHDSGDAAGRREGSLLGNALRRIFAVGFGPHRDVLVDEIRQRADELNLAAAHQADAATDSLARVDAEVAGLHRELDEIRSIVRTSHDDIAWLRRRLWQVRDTEEYDAVWKEDEPLVTVRIATWNRAKELAERPLASVLAQDYEHWECIVVGDGCTDDTADVVAAIGDPRISFVNLPHRSALPADDRDRWYVAGAHAMNIGARLARGTWIAPLDDDDTWTPDHLTSLLAVAAAGRFELAYGRLRQQWLDLPKERLIGTYPPSDGGFSFQGALYLRLLGFFEYDTSSWALREPGDWNLCRRMVEAGVRIGYTDAVVGTTYFKMKEHHFDLYAPDLAAEFGQEALDEARRKAGF